jgi:FAD synthetase
MPKPKTIMVFGTFDIIHPGHLNFFEQAKSIAGPEARLVVVVSKDLNAKQAKGMFPINNESMRTLNVKKIPIVNDAVLGDSTDKFRAIEKVKPDMIGLGYDQKMPEGFEEWLNRSRMEIEIKRLNAYRPEQYKSSRIRGIT